MLFQKKKIQIETLSEYLAAVRSNLNLSVEEVAKKTGISAKFLVSLENGNFNILPAEVYVVGFLKQLANLYAIDSEELVEQYKREKGIQKQLGKQVMGLNPAWPGKFWGKVVITPKILTLVLGLALVVLTVGYIFWQVWSINKTPNLQIDQPADNAVIQSSFVQISGKTDPGMIVSINGESIFVDSNGRFQTQLGLSVGPKAIVITAKNNFDKSTSKTINVLGVSNNNASTSTSP